MDYLANLTIMKNTGFVGTNRKWVVQSNGHTVLTCNTKKECLGYVKYYNTKRSN